MIVSLALALAVAAQAPADPQSRAAGGGKAWTRGPVVRIETSLGTIRVGLDKEKAPTSVENFVSYVRDRHYDGTIFHRVISTFMIQGGGFDTELKQKPTKPPIKLEAGNGLHNT